MLTERTLKHWRKEALKLKLGSAGANFIPLNQETTNKLYDCILRMTQELLDLHLIRK